jgi:hypothetical protein
MGYAIGDLVPWPLPPTWGQAVTETLAWLTDVLVARDGTQQKRQLRLAPRRAFAFRVVANEDNLRLLDAVSFDQGVRQWLLPIYPDGQRLEADLAAGATTLPCRTAGFDFIAGGEALLWRSGRAWERISIDAVGDGVLTLTAGPATAWGAGTRLYPLRLARLQQPPKANAHSAAVATVDVTLQIDEPCDWPAAWPSAVTYRGVPVLEWRPDESDGIDLQYDRLTDTVDESTGPVSYFDLPGMPFRAQGHAWVLSGRAQQGAFRSFLYQLAGRAGQMWVPSWRADLQLTAAAAADDTSLMVSWCGYTVFGREQVNRKDIRIELWGGTVLYRRITGSIEYSDGEQLNLDSALGLAIDPADVRQISFLSMCQLAADTVQLQHKTDADGVALAGATWQAVKHDL